MKEFFDIISGSFAVIAKASGIWLLSGALERK
jgi:hypothetical protein